MVFNHILNAIFLKVNKRNLGTETFFETLKVHSRRLSPVSSFSSNLSLALNFTFLSQSHSHQTPLSIASLSISFPIAHISLNHARIHGWNKKAHLRRWRRQRWSSNLTPSPLQNRFVFDSGIRVFLWCFCSASQFFSCLSLISFSLFILHAF